MKRFLAITLVLLAVVVSSASAATVKVQPSNMNGWVQAVETGATASWSDGLDPLKPNYGTEAVRLYNGSSGGKAAVGTDAYKGININQISSWTMSVMWDTRQANYGQPPSIELITWTGQPRHFEFFPWGKTAYPAGSEPWARGTWTTVDLMSPTGYWELANTSSSDRKGNWAWVVNRYLSGAQPIYSASLNGAYGESINGVGMSVKIGAAIAGSGNGEPGNGDANQKNLNGFVDWMDITIAGSQTKYDFGVPEPGSILALATGLIGFIGLRKRF